MQANSSSLLTAECVYRVHHVEPIVIDLFSASPLLMYPLTPLGRVDILLAFPRLPTPNNRLSPRTRLQNHSHPNRYPRRAGHGALLGSSSQQPCSNAGRRGWYCEQFNREFLTPHTQPCAMRTDELCTFCPPPHDSHTCFSQSHSS